MIRLGIIALILVMLAVPTYAQQPTVQVDILPLEAGERLPLVRGQETNLILRLKNQTNDVVSGQLKTTTSRALKPSFRAVGSDFLLSNELTMAANETRYITLRLEPHRSLPAGKSRYVEVAFVQEKRPLLYALYEASLQLPLSATSSDYFQATMVETLPKKLNLKPHIESFSFQGIDRSDALGLQVYPGDTLEFASVQSGPRGPLYTALYRKRNADPGVLQARTEASTQVSQFIVPINETERTMYLFRLHTANASGITKQDIAVTVVKPSSLSVSTQSLSRPSIEKHPPSRKK